MVARILIVSIVLFSALFGWGQSLRFEINSTKISVGERVELKVISDINGSIDIKTPKTFHYGTAEQSSMQQQLDHSGRLTVQMSYIRDGYFDAPGNFVLGPVTLKSGKKSVTSNTINVVVTKNPTNNPSRGSSSYSERELKKPAFGVVEPNKSKIYEGESVVLQAKVLARLFPDNINRYKAYAIDGSVSNYELGNPEQINSSKEQIAGFEWNTFTFDRKVLFFDKKGTYKIKPFDINLEIDFGYLGVRSNSPSIEVIPLPANKPKDFIGIVGDIQLAFNVQSKPIKKGDILTFKIELKGKGNIQNALVPSVNVPKGWQEYAAPKPTSRYTFTEFGAEGSLVYEYAYKCVEEKPSNWDAITLSYFDPSIGKYKTLQTDPIVFNEAGVSMAKNQESKGDPKEMSKTSLIQNASNETETDSPFKSPILWLTLASIVAFAFLIGAIGRPKFRKKKFSSLDYNKPFIAPWYLVESDIEKALKSFALGDKSDAVQYLENAVSKSISIKLEIDYREVSTASMVQSYIDKSTNLELNQKINDFFYQAQLYRYGYGISEDDWQNIQALSIEVMSLLKK